MSEYKYNFLQHHYSIDMYKKRVLFVDNILIFLRASVEKISSIEKLHKRIKIKKYYLD